MPGAGKARGKEAVRGPVLLLKPAAHGGAVRGTCIILLARSLGMGAAHSPESMFKGALGLWANVAEVDLCRNGRSRGVGGGALRRLP